MCMEDIKLGRETASNVKAFAAPNGTLVAPANSKRIRLTFSKSGTGTINVYPSRLSRGASAVIGIQLTDGFPTVTVSVEEFGDCVTDDWFATFGGATEAVTVIDAYLSREK